MAVASRAPRPGAWASPHYRRQPPAGRPANDEGRHREKNHRACQAVEEDVRPGGRPLAGRARLGKAALLLVHPVPFLPLHAPLPVLLRLQPDGQRQRHGDGRARLRPAAGLDSRGVAGQQHQGQLRGFPGRRAPAAHGQDQGGHGRGLRQDRRHAGSLEHQRRSHRPGELGPPGGYPVDDHECHGQRHRGVVAPDAGDKGALQRAGADHRRHPGRLQPGPLAGDNQVRDRKWLSSTIPKGYLSQRRRRV